MPPQAKQPHKSSWITRADYEKHIGPSDFYGVRDVARGRIEGETPREHQIKAIETFIRVGYDLPRLFSETIDPYFPVMRHYSDFLHDQTRTMASFLSEIAGHHDAFASNCWLAAQKYVGSLAASVGALSSSVHNFEPHFHMLQKAVPPQIYLARISELAQVMSRNAGPAYTDAVAFWVAAETHVLTIRARSIANATNVSDAIDSLIWAFSEFEALTYLARIQEGAYYIWQSRGEPPGQALDHWLMAEDRALALMASLAP